MYYHYSKVNDLPERLQRTCHYNNLGKNGMMRYVFEGCNDPNRNVHGYAIMLFEDEYFDQTDLDFNKKVSFQESKKHFIGWGLLFIGGNYYYPNPVTYKNEYHLYVYVRNPHRKNGYGTMIYQLARHHKPKVKIVTHPWNPASEAMFYNAYGKRKDQQKLQAIKRLQI